MTIQLLLQCTASKVDRLRHAACGEHPQHGVKEGIRRQMRLLERIGQCLAAVDVQMEAALRRC